MDEFKIRWFNTGGVLQAETIDWLSIAYQKKVNYPGVAKVAIVGTHSLVDTIADKWLVEIWRRNLEQGVNWYREFEGIVRGIRKIGIDPGVVEIAIPGPLHMLSWRHILWYAGTTNRSEFINKRAETILKTLVTYNATSSASTANGRLRAGNLSVISVESDGGGGNYISHYCAWDGLLESLQTVAEVAGGDFDLVKTGGNAWQFRWYAGQLGTDRTGTVTFSIERANMANPIYISNYQSEKTVALVAGKGEEEFRETVTRTGTNYNVSTNNIEDFVDARNVKEGDTLGLSARGDKVLAEKQLEADFSFDVLQTPSCYYGKHYFLGDLVEVESPFTGTGVTKKIEEVAVATHIDEITEIKVVTVDA